MAASAVGGSVGAAWGIKVLIADYRELKARVLALEKVVSNLMSREEVQEAARLLARDLEDRRTKTDDRLREIERTMLRKDDLKDAIAPLTDAVKGLDTRLRAVPLGRGQAD